MPLTPNSNVSIGQIMGSTRPFGLFRNPAAHSNNVTTTEVGRCYVPDIENDGAGGSGAGSALGKTGNLGNWILPNDDAAAARPMGVCLDAGKVAGEIAHFECFGEIDVLCSAAVTVGQRLECAIANTANERGTLIPAAGGGNAPIVAVALETNATGTTATPVLVRCLFGGFLAWLAFQQ